MGYFFGFVRRGRSLRGMGELEKKILDCRRVIISTNALPEKEYVALDEVFKVLGEMWSEWPYYKFYDPLTKAWFKKWHGEDSKAPTPAA